MFHGVKIQDQALIAAATLSNRYITDRFLPDKAIDLVDEACAMIRSEMDSMPAEMDELNRKIMRHEIEEAALKKETDTLSQEHLQDIQKELADMRAQFNEMKAKWENEKNAIGKVQKLREEIEKLNAELDKAKREYDLNRAAEIEYGKLPQLQKGAGAGGAALPRKASAQPAARPRDRRGNRPHRGPLDGHPGQQADGGRAREAAASG